MNADVRLNSLINRKRTYIAGFSNGAQMCFRAAVDMANVYAAAACHVGSMVGVHSPAPPAPHIPVFDSIGNEDDNIVTAYQQFVPNATKFPMLPRLIANPGASADLSQRLESFGLATTPSNTLFANRKRYTLQWNTALPGNTDGNEYRFTMLDGVTHQYPAGAGQKDNTHDFKMTSLVYPFFAAHPKP